MGYKLIIENKTFDAVYLEWGLLEISLNEESDILMFKKWEDLRKPGVVKRKYTKHVVFEKITECGVLEGCFPELSENEDVFIRFDLKKVW